jgi:hypothetical protein
MTFKTLSQETAGQKTTKNSQIVSTAIKAFNSGGLSTSGPAITSVIVTDSGYSNLDDTAVATSNSFIKIIGTGFSSGANVYVGGTQVPAANVTFTSSTELRVALPVLTSGANNTLSVFNPTGSGGISASELLASGFPTVTTTSYLQNSLTVNAQILATGDGTLTYALKSGSSLPAGVSLAANGVISGTVTGDSTTIFTVLVSDSQNQTTQQDITLVISNVDSFFNYTPLLLQADNTSNNATNNSFVDSSNNYNIVTASGTPIQGSINPFGVGNWSNSFNGSTQYLTLPSNAAFSFGTGNFTIEYWVNPVSHVSYAAHYSSTTTFEPSNNIRVGAGAQANTIAVASASAVLITSSDTLNVGQWYHVAVVRNSGTLALYVNGVLQGTQSNSQNFVSDTPLIGAVSPTSYMFNGYISNLRVVKGTAVYTSNFTPSTTPLTAIANTVLLTCQSNRFVDNSTNAFTVIPTSSPKVERSNPFDVNANSYTTSANTFVGSTSFSGTGQYLDFDGANLALGTGDFTIEMWIYANSYGQGGADSRLAGSQNNGNAGWQMAIRNSGTINFGSWSTATDSTLLAPVQSWNHIAWTRQSGVEKFYINGALSNTVTRSLNMTTTATSIGRVFSTSNLWNGYVSNFRIVKGTAVYTSAFTPPTSPLTAITNTVFLTCQNSQLLQDESTNKYSITKTGTPQQTLKKPFALTDTSTANTIHSGSTYFNGTSDYLSTPINTSLQFGTGDFTIECWTYLTAKTTNQPCIFSNYNNFTTGALSLFAGHSSSSTTLYQVAINGTFPAIQSTTTIVYNTWVHLAVVRNSGIVTLYINGVANGTVDASAASLNGVGSSFTVGVSGDNIAATYINGYVSNFRVVKGTAVYTGAFTPATTPLQPTANTSLLLSGTNAGLYDATLLNNIQFSGDARVRTDVTKYGTGSIYFDGTTDYALANSATHFGYGTGDFTIEFWMYSVNPAANQTVFSHLTSVNSTQPYIYTNINTIRYYTGGGDRITGGTLTANTWYHVALCRSSGNTKLFLNGTQVGSTYTDSNNYGTTAPLVLATYYNPAGTIVTSNMFNGYLDDVRITKGYARYTGNFTPAGSAFNTRSR